MSVTVCVCVSGKLQHLLSSTSVAKCFNYLMSKNANVQKDVRVLRCVSLSVPVFVWEREEGNRDCFYLALGMLCGALLGDKRKRYRWTENYQELWQRFINETPSILNGIWFYHAVCLVVMHVDRRLYLFYTQFCMKALDQPVGLPTPANSLFGSLTSTSKWFFYKVWVRFHGASQC